MSWYPANRICSFINSKLEFSTTLASRVLAIHAVNAIFARLSSSMGSQLSEALIERGVQVCEGVSLGRWRAAEVVRVAPLRATQVFRTLRCPRLPTPPHRIRLQKEMWAITVSLHVVVLVGFVSILLPFHAVIRALYLKSAVFKCKWNASLDPSSPTRRNMKIR